MKVRRPPTEQEKIFANHISDKGFVSRIYKELLQLNNKTDSLIKNGQMDMSPKKIHKWPISL